MGGMNATWRIRLARTIAVVLCSVWIMSGCASASQRPVTGHSPDAGEEAAKTAVSMIGRPYKYKGDSPAGFDCSGLVKYSYLSTGLDVPHGTRELKQATIAVSSQTMRKGDLLFFSERGKNYSHVGLYLENNLFVHAPGKRGKVRTDSLKDPYWEKSFLEARRFP
jgi:cell wall-associated NlpC family hydrolase